MADQIFIRNAVPGDLDAVVSLDETSTQEKKLAYWREVFDRYVNVGREDRFFLVAETHAQTVGFLIGEVRAWEFGSPPCGWVFAITVSPKVRELGVGQRMFEETCNRLKKIGITTVRTMVDRDNKVTLSFFRSQGMRTGRYVELEKQII
jgi:ribosomal protein S18 acetylase RimI-like enzyme